ncbi:MAG: hypothetical protein IT368_00660 [Candidatus Hydrogenedentes bacterium]|nr:hypothetical protein [Candidatus Hydrogenedentota bacterium]
MKMHLLGIRVARTVRRGSIAAVMVLAPILIGGTIALAQPSTNVAQEEAVQTLRNGPDGTVEVLEGGAVVEVYPKGSLVISKPDPAQLEMQSQQRATAQAIAEAQAEGEAAAEKARAAEAAKTEAEQKAAAEKRAAALEKRREAYRDRAIQVLNGDTGVYETVVPLDAVKQIESAGRKPAKQRRVADPAKPEEAGDPRAMSILNLNSGGYIQAVPLDQLLKED